MVSESCQMCVWGRGHIRIGTRIEGTQGDTGESPTAFAMVGHLRMEGFDVLKRKRIALLK